MIDLAQVQNPFTIQSDNYRNWKLFADCNLLLHALVKCHVMSLGQAIHRMEVRVTRGAEGKSGKVFVGNLSEENAIDLAGKVISEGFVWGVRSPGLVYLRSMSPCSESLEEEAT